MQWTQLISSGLPAVAVVPLGAPWPVMALVVVAGLVSYGWDRYLSHVENMKALDKTNGNQVANVVHEIAARSRRPQAARGPTA